MPRDVTTCWNLTFDLLEYALKHRKAINLVTQQRELGLRKFEMTDHEWMVVEQLHSILNVSIEPVVHMNLAHIDNTLFDE